jgi:multidrug resistance protein
MRAGEFVARLWVLMLTVFVDMIGFLIVLPLLPFYAEKLGADPTRVGALVAIFAVGQLASAPLWGRLSDRLGRRPMILAGLLISAVSYIVFESAITVWMLFLSRFVQGTGGGTVGVVQAYLSDSVERQERAKALGWLTAATSAGVMIGPAIGSLAASLGWVGPGYLAAGLCVLNFLFGLIWLPEPLTSRRRGEKPDTPSGATRTAILEVLLRPAGPVGALIWIYSFVMMAFMAMNGVIALYLERAFGVTEATIGWFYTYVGGVSLVMRTLILAPTVKRLGEVATLRLGLLSIAGGMVCLTLAANFLQLAMAALFVPVGTALLFPAVTSMVSHRATEGQTGLILGVQQSFGGVARMLGPLWAGAAFQYFGIHSPFYLAGGLVLAVWLFSRVVREDEPADELTADAEVAVPNEPA